MDKKMADLIDMANDLADYTTTRYINQHKARHRIQAEYTANGAKICLDCTDVIPIQRAKIEGVVRCIDCQILEER